MTVVGMEQLRKSDGMKRKRCAAKRSRPAREWKGVVIVMATEALTVEVTDGALVLSRVMLI